MLGTVSPSGGGGLYPVVAVRGGRAGVLGLVHHRPFQRDPDRFASAPFRSGTGTRLEFHHIWFDLLGQHGCVEFTFRREGTETADHGAIVIELSGGLIAVWREYVQQGPASFADFTAVHGKRWRWHIANYP